MSCDSSVLHIQSVLRSLVRDDPDAVIQAASGLETGELQRMRHLMDLALQWKEQPDSSGLVDCGLEPLQQDLAQAPQVSTGVPDRGGAAPPVKEPPPRPSSTSSTLASPSGLPQAPPGAPPAKSPTVQPPPSGCAQGNLAVAVPSTSAGSSGQVASASQASQDPWRGWHPGLLGRGNTSANPAPTLSEEGRWRSRLSAQGLQPGTPVFDYGQATGTGRPRRPDPDIRDLTPSALERLGPEAWNYIGWFQGLPPIHGMADMPKLRERRARTLAKSLRMRNFSLSGYCLLECSFACSRPVSTDGRGTHSKHECTECHGDD